MKLLIVDDQHSVHRLLAHCLDTEALGIDQLLHAENGREALEMVEKEQPELMLLDIEMPGMDGMEVSEMLKDRPEPRVMILSAYSTFEYARQALHNRVQNYLLKPIDMEEITRVLAENIEEIQSQARQELMDAARAFLHAEVLTAEQQNALAGWQKKAGIRQYGLLGSRSAPVPPAGEGMVPGFTASFTWGSVCLYTFSTPGQWDAFRAAQQEQTPGTHLGFSQAFDDFGALLVCYRQMAYALRQGFYTPHVALYDADYFSDTISPDCEALLGPLQEAARQGGRAWMERAADDLFCQFCEDRLDPRLVAEVCRSVLLQCRGPVASAEELAPEAGVHTTAAQVRQSFFQALLACREDQPAPAKTDAQIVEDIHQYVDAHYDCELSLEAVARQFFINKYQISRIFKKKYHLKYQEYIIHVRMEKAAALIANSDQKLYEIAQAVGYNDASYFSMAFKKYHGITPNRYRNEHKKEAR